MLGKLFRKVLSGQRETFDAENSRGGFGAAAEVPFPDLPRTSSSKATPSYITSARPSTDTFLPQEDLRLATADVEAFRRLTPSTQALLRQLYKASPDLSAAVFTSNRMAVSSGYRVLARNLDGTLSSEGTRLVQQLCRLFDMVGPVRGYNDFPSIRSTAESLGLEVMLLGGCSMELVLNSARLPEGLRPLSIEGLKFKYDSKKRKVPYQRVGGRDISLDVPTFFYEVLDQDLKTAYAESPVQASLQPIQADQTFQNDTRRVLKRAIHPRLTAQINYEVWKKSVPPNILHDPEKLQSHTESMVSQLRSVLDGLRPDDALVYFDTVDMDYLTGGNNSLSEEYKVLSNILNGKMSAGTKAAPVILAHEAASSTNIASTQSMLAVKTYSGVQDKLNEILSRALTLAVRLYGLDVVVEFAFHKIDLRPDSELETYKSVRQARFLELLSYGLIDDEEASLELTGSLPVPGAPKLSGTMFTVNKPELSNPDSNTSAMNQTLKPDTPAGVKSQNR